MAFNLRMDTEYTDGTMRCDKCHKPGSKDRLLVDMWITSRDWDQRQFIVIHEDCLWMAIAKARGKVRP